MAWFPGYERLYNEHLSPRITYGLGKTILVQAGLARLHPGLAKSYYGDVFTPSLLIRSRLQLQSKHWVSDTPAVVISGASKPTGGKNKRR